MESWNEVEHYIAKVISERDLYKEQCIKLQEQNEELKAMLELDENKYSGLLEED